MSEKVNTDITILQHLAAKKARQREKMAYVRSFLTHKNVRKHSDETVSNVRTAYYASRSIKGFSIAEIAVLMRLPIATVRGWLFTKGIRKANAAQINMDKVAFYKARFTKILATHVVNEEALRKDRRSSNPQHYTTAEITKMHFPENNLPLQTNATEADFTAQANQRAEIKVFNELDVIIGRPPLSLMEAAEAVSYYARQKFMSTHKAIKLRGKYMKHHNI